MKTINNILSLERLTNLDMGKLAIFAKRIMECASSVIMKKDALYIFMSDVQCKTESFEQLVKWIFNEIPKMMKAAFYFVLIIRILG